jgi:hypothetical protein
MIIAIHAGPPDAKISMWLYRKLYGDPPPGILCPAGGGRLDFTTMNPKFKAPRSYFDLLRTYDGDFLVSVKLREYLENSGLVGLKFLSIPSTRRFSVMLVSNVLKLSPLPTLRREEYCEVCREYRSVYGVKFVNDTWHHGFQGVDEPIPCGLYFSDLRFGFGSRMGPILIVGLDTWADLKAQEFKGIDGFPIDNRLNSPPRL